MITTRAAAIALAVLAPIQGGDVARAHGTIPTSNSISFGPDDGGVLLGTNFGGVLRVAGGDDRFVCERLVTGEQTSVDVWLWLGGGGVAGVVTAGGFIRGVFASDEDACGFVVVPGTEPLLMTDLVADPESDRGFWAVGASTGDAAEARLVRRAASGVDIVATAAGAIATTVRAAGGHAYTIFLTDDEARLVHVSPDGQETFVHPRLDEVVWQPLGVDPEAPETLWVVERTSQNDVLHRSVDGGETLTPVLTVTARLGGFAIGGGSVWVQSPQLGIHRSSDGGVEFAPVPGSPHGSCLARAGDGRVFACGVPWQDGMALGVSADGTTFTALLPYYDGIAGALDCADGEATALCTDELTFLRAYYGFSDPAVVEAVEGAEVVEPVEPVEGGPEPAPEQATEQAGPGGSDDGCRGGGARAADGPGGLAVAFGLALVALGLGRARASRRRS